MGYVPRCCFFIELLMICIASAHHQIASVYVLSDPVSTISCESVLEISKCLFCFVTNRYDAVEKMGKILRFFVASASASVEDTSGPRALMSSGVFLRI